MGFKFRKSIKVAPGVKVNLSRKGVGVSAGVKGARVSTGQNYYFDTWFRVIL